MRLSQPEFSQLLETVRKRHRRTQYLMDVEAFIPGTIDEMAILFPDNDTLESFMFLAASTPGIRHDRSVESDHMNYLPRGVGDGEWAPFEDGWDVRFEFFKTSEPYRIEAMVRLGGHAPLHEVALEEQGGKPCVFHASFKQHSVEGYEEMKQRLSERTRKGAAFEAEYQNSYGRFSYWSVSVIPWLYVKPRVNLRD